MGVSQLLLLTLALIGHQSYAQDTEITRFNVETEIQMRYAVTQVEMQVKNLASEAGEVVFDMYIPEEAFVSNFTMEVNDQTYVAKVEEKEMAKNIFDESETSSGLVQSQRDPEFKDGKQITFSAKVDPQEEIVFKLNYEELLQRTNGQYQYQLNIQPKDQLIKDLNIYIRINETLPLKDISVQKVKSRGEIISKAESITDETVIFDPEFAPREAEIVYRLPTQSQTSKDWKLLLNYDVDRPVDGSDIQIAGGRFVHYFAPDNLETLPKHVTFVIDVSGSMNGDKLKQTKDAMAMILESLNTIDSLNILSFSDEVYPFNSESNEKLSWSVDKLGVLEPLQHCLNMRTIGGTNIHDAMIAAIETASDVKKAEEISDKTQQMIIFLTDGEATTGETNDEVIKENVKNANVDKIPIYGLAFGRGADFGLISKISEENFGFARRIYESGNSFEQLEDFYKEISDPKLKNVKFQYFANGQVLNPANLSKTEVDYAFGKNEYAIVGEFGEDTTEIEIVIETEDGTIDTIKINPCGPVALPAQIDQIQGDFEYIDEEQSIDPEFVLGENFINHGCIPPMPNPPQINTPVWQQTPTEKFMERLWAFKRIKYLLNDKEDCTLALRNDPEVPEQIENGDYIEIPDSSEENSNEISGEDFEVESNEVSDENICENEAINLAKQFNFVTEVTSMVVESTDDYVNNGVIDLINPQLRPSYNDFSQSMFARPTGYRPMMRVNSSPQYSPRGRPGKPLGGRRRNSATYGGRLSPIVNSSPQYSPRGNPQRTPPRGSGLEQSAWFPRQTTTTTPRPLTCRGGTMDIWSQTYLRGNSVKLTYDIDLANLGFDDKLGSLEIKGRCCWEIYTEPNFGGEMMKFSPGKYESSTQLITVFKTASSAKMVVC